MNVTSDLTLTLLNRGMDALSARQTAISNNIANIETPNYKAADVAFEDSLRTALNRSGSGQALLRTDDDHLDHRGEKSRGLEGIQPRTYQRNQISMRRDGNNVDVELEMVHMAETAMRFQAMTTLASKKLSLMRMVAQETR